MLPNNKPECSILIATHKRNHVLKWNLESLIKQNNNVEIIVLDDYYIPDVECQELIRTLNTQANIQYIHSGITKNGVDKWRIPGFAYNIGAKQANADIIILCCGEMYHIGNTTKFIIDTIKQNKKMLCTTNGINDRDGGFLNKLNVGDNITISDCMQSNLIGLLVAFPFFLGMRKQEYIDVGGYDERFIGMSYDDTDLIYRLLRNGCTQSHGLAKLPKGYIELIPTPSDCYIIHLYTPHVTMSKNTERVNINKRLYEENNQNNTIEVNKHNQWGVM